MERLSNLGYLGLGEQSAADTPVTPDVFVPLYEEDLTTNQNVDEDNPIMGNRAARYQTLPGMRSHNGSLTVMAEPNTSAYLWSMLLARGSVSGGGPYTWPFTLGASKSYTIEILKGMHAFRFWGVKASSISPNFDDNKMTYTMAVSARGSFTTRVITGVSGVGPTTITFDTKYDPSPTKGLVVGDLIHLYDITGDAYINGTVTAVTATTIDVSEDLSAGAAGDIVSLRTLTPSFTLLAPFKWARTEFRFGADAATALSATQTRLEQGSTWNMMHRMKDEEGEKRSGGYDPAAIVHTQGDAELNITQIFDTPVEYNRYMDTAKNACVIRSFSGSGYELRVTLNNLRLREANPPMNTGDIILLEEEYVANYDTSDAQIFDVKVLNNLASL